MIVKLLTEHHLEFLSLTGGCAGSSESTLIKMPHCWKSHALAHMRMSSDVYFLIGTLGLHEVHSKTIMKQIGNTHNRASKIFYRLTGLSIYNYCNYH